MGKVHRTLIIAANFALAIKRIVIFVLLFVIALGTYELLLDELISGQMILLPLLLIWLLTAYIVLPRIHRRLSKIYIPDYFIGRVRTGDGLLGDPVNILVHGNKQNLVASMKKAGWVQADELNSASTIKMIKSSVLKRSYPSAPVSSLFLFGEKQELAFQIEVNGNPHARHHVRFWRTPSGWYLPGGLKADWLGAATFDRQVGFSLFTGQITHKIEENTDIERDFVGDTVSRKTEATSTILPHFMSSYRDRNGGGDSIKTDGGLLEIKL